MILAILKPETVNMNISECFIMYLYQTLKFIKQAVMISFKDQRKYEAVKKSTHQLGNHKKQIFLRNYPKSPETTDFKLFQWDKASQPQLSKETLSNPKFKSQTSQKFSPNDESHHQHESKMHESIFFSKNVVRQNDYFQQPLSFRPKKLKGPTRKRDLKNSKLQSISIKLGQMKELVRSQDRELKKLKYSLSEQQLHRLLKIHSIQKLKLMQNINAFRDSSNKRSTNR